MSVMNRRAALGSLIAAVVVAAACSGGQQQQQQQYPDCDEDDRLEGDEDCDYDTRHRPRSTATTKGTPKPARQRDRRPPDRVERKPVQLNKRRP